MSIERKQSNSEYLILQKALRHEVLFQGQAQVGYVMSETADNQPASLKQASQLLQEGVIEKIAIVDPFPPYIYGYPGPEYCKQILYEHNIQENLIVSISPDVYIPSLNTQTELATLAQYLKKSEYDDNLIIIAPWFHILRSYITALSEFKNAGLNVKIFISNVSLPIFENVRHSQGIQEGTRRKIFYQEIKKCQTYDNLIPIQEALDTFKEQRSSISN